MNSTLDQLVTNKDIKSYHLDSINENGDVGKSKFNNSERLTIVFNSGKILVANIVCSGCLENTSFSFETM